MSTVDYSQLFSEALDKLPRLSFGRWTDYNATDPGITILEYLCYALTDVDYRLNYSIPDLLASDPESNEPYESLYSAAKILTCSPVTIEDLRRSVIDCEGTSNAWVSEVECSPKLYFAPRRMEISGAQSPGARSLPLSGIYRVDIQSNKSQTGIQLTREATARLHETRPLCSDFQQIETVNSQGIGIIATVELNLLAEPTSLLSEIYLACENFLAPQIPTHTLQEEVSRGESSEDIFQGPEMWYGFPDSLALAKSPRRLQLHSSDFIHLISDLTGVAVVRSLSLTTGEIVEPWVLELDSEYCPDLDLSLCEIQLVRGPITLQPDQKAASHVYQEASTSAKEPLLDFQRDIVIPAGNDRQVDSYFSIQEEFPEVYGIGEGDLPLNASEARTAWAKQLQAYLMVFEQFLTDDLSQIAHLNQLLGFNDEKQTYFVQPLEGASAFTVESDDSPDISSVDDLHGLSETEKQAQHRKDRFLTHLLARFGEDLPEFGPPELTAKADFLKNYPILSGERICGFNLLEPAWETDNVGGYKKRLCHLLGITDVSERALANGETPGFHVVEHLLLRPSEGDFDGQSPPSSFAITSFASDENGGTRCTTETLGDLRTNDFILITPSPYDGTYQVTDIDSNSSTFVIAAPFDENSSPSSGYWTFLTQRSEDLAFLALSEPIASFSPSANGDHLITCTGQIDPSSDGERIEVRSAQRYDGVWPVSNITETTFDIPGVYDEDRTGCWYYPDQPSDPFSNQISLVFPSELPNMIKTLSNDAYRAFVEDTIIRETPAHLTVYVHWLSAETLDEFESEFQPWLESFPNNQGQPDFSHSLALMELLGIGHPIDLNPSPS